MITKRVAVNYCLYITLAAILLLAFVVVIWPLIQPVSHFIIFFQVDTYLMLLTTSSDAFYHLKDCR